MSLVSAFTVLLALAVGIAPQAAPDPGALTYSIEVDIHPTSRWEESDFEAVFALRDTRNGSRLGSIELQVAKGRSRSSSEELPGGLGTLHVEIELEGSKSASYTIEVKRDGRPVITHRARIRLER